MVANLKPGSTYSDLFTDIEKLVREDFKDFPDEGIVEALAMTGMVGDRYRAFCLAYELQARENERESI